MVFKKGQKAWNKGLPKEQQPNYGYVHTKETRRKIGLKHKGKTISDEHKANLSSVMKGNTIWLGKTHTQETKDKISKSQTGENNNKWKGGRVRTTAGYIKIHSPKHPCKDKKGYVMEHRLVMEQYIDRYLSIQEVVHHINDIRDDNRLSNLALFNNKGEHKRFHLKRTRERLETVNFSLYFAMEWGYKAHEKGWNFDKTKIEFTKILQGDEK